MAKKAKTPRSHTRLTLKLSATDRASVRREVFNHWLSEKPGTAALFNTYRYDVELLPDDSQIYLTRPARLNRGADFVVYCEGFIRWKNGKPKPPSHKHLSAAIASLVSRSAKHSEELLRGLRQIWECEDSNSVIARLKLFRGDLDAIRALLVAKWLFIEQDVTYWTESGRHMLRDSLEKQYGAFPS